MSFLTSTLRASRPAFTQTTTRFIAQPSTSLFHSSARRFALSENDRHREDAAKEEIEHHTNDTKQKQKDGKGEWKPELASSSESAIKADRGELDASEKTISEMQKETEEMAKKK